MVIWARSLRVDQRFGKEDIDMSGMTKEQIIATILRTGNVGNVGTAMVAAAVKAAENSGVKNAR